MNIIYTHRLRNILKNLVLQPLVMLSFFVAPFILKGQALSGSYTINSATVTGLTNFQTFKSAVDTLTKYGVSGQAVFNVQAGTFNERVVVPAITGTSSTNTVTFDGGVGNAATRIITNTSTVSASRSTFQINGSPYIILRNLTIEANGATSAWGVQFFGAGSSNCKIKNCIINIGGGGLTSTTNSFCGIIANGSATGATTGAKIDSLEIDSNTINYGYYAIGQIGVSAGSFNIKIRGNIINNAAGNAIYLTYNNNAEVSKNTITLRSDATVSRGIYLNNCTSTGSNNGIVSDNKILNPGTYGISIANSPNSGTVKGILSNNTVTGTFLTNSSYGLYLEASSNWNVLFNSVNKSVAGSTNTKYASLYIEGGTGITVFNNILSITGTGASLPFYITSPASIDSMNYNILHTVNPTTAVYLYLTSNLILQNSHSIVTNTSPFIDSLNLHIHSECLRGIAIGNITTDLDNATRSLTPSIGAYEYTGTDNIGIEALVMPVVATGLQDLVVRVRNNGNTAIGNFTISYRLNNDVPVTQFYSSPILNPCDTVSIVFTGLNQINLSRINSLLIYTSEPNNVTDVHKVNDTLKTMIYAPLNGNYTIDASGADFATISEAANYMGLYGVNGPVVLTIDSGIYAERVVIPFIPGASATNTIVFDGGAGNANTRIITYNSASTSANRATVQIGSSYTSLKNVTVETTGATYGWGIQILGAITASQIKNCTINITGAGTSSTSTNFAGIVVSNSATSATSAANVSDLEIDSNSINYGYYGISHQGASSTVQVNNKFRYNTINNSHTNGIYIRYHESGQIIGNKIISREGVTNSRSIYLSDCNSSGGNFTSIIGNRIINPTGQFGISIGSSSNNGSQKGIIANNVVGGKWQNTSAVGIYVQQSDKWNIHHNSVNKDIAGSASPTSAAMYISSGINISLLNNIFAVTGLGLGLPLYVTDPLSIDALDYNLYYTVNTGGNLIYIGTAFDEANYQGALGWNANSIVTPPNFTNDSNLMITKGCNNGIYIGTLANDINGNIRNNPPDIGAYEFQSIVNNISVSQLLQPALGSVLTGLQDLSALVKNEGTTVSSFSISYTLNNAPPVTQVWSGILPPCASIPVTFTGAHQINMDSVNEITVYTTNPNTIADAFPENDTLKITLLTPLNGTYTIGATGADFISFNDALLHLKQGGVSGPVTFNVQSGTYTEQLIVPAIVGVNQVNHLTFQSAALHADSVVLNYNAGTTGAVITLENTNFIQFKSLSIISTTSGRGVELTGSSSSDSITDCTIRVAHSGIYANSFIGSNNVFSRNTILNSVYGMYLRGTSSQHANSNVIAYNTISTLSNSNAGCYIFNNSYLTINGNKITTDSFGIEISFCRRLLITNNQIISNTGIKNYYGYGQRFYHNSIQALHQGLLVVYQNSADSANKWMNNIVTCNGSGNAANLQNNGVNNHWDYNLYHTTGSHLFYNSDSAFILWKKVEQDAHSVIYRPAFTSSNHLQPDANDTASWALNGRGIHLTDSTLTNKDITETSRPTRVYMGVPDIGAYEFTPYSGVLSPMAKITGSLTSDSTQAFLSAFNNDTIAKIKWTGLNTPSQINMRQYVGVVPPAIGNADHYMYYYNHISEIGTGPYDFSLNLYYNDSWLGTIPNETDLRIINKTPGNDWILPIQTPNSIVNVSQNLVSDNMFSHFGLFTGTDMITPLPVKLLSFDAVALNKDVLLTWVTASELNANRFIIEYSNNTKNWYEIEKIKANGNSTSKSQYRYTDINAFAKSNTLFYRLKIVDHNGSYSYSNTVSVSVKTQLVEKTIVYPNPFTENMTIETNSENAGTISYQLINITGKELGAQIIQQLSKGKNELIINTTELDPGIYFLSINTNGSTQTIKVVKQ